MASLSLVNLLVQGLASCRGWGKAGDQDQKIAAFSSSGPKTTTDSWLTQNIVGARLAGEGDLGYCIVLSGLFAGKPAPTGPRTATDSWPTQYIVGARLGGEGGLGYCIVLSGLFAGKPAPTGPRTAKDSWSTQNIVGARLAGEGGLGYCIVFSGLFAGKPAPTWSEGSQVLMADT
jgi:hypothetical protein